MSKTEFPKPKFHALAKSHFLFYLKNLSYISEEFNHTKMYAFDTSTTKEK